MFTTVLHHLYLLQHSLWKIKEQIALIENTKSSLVLAWYLISAVWDLLYVYLFFAVLHSHRTGLQGGLFSSETPVLYPFCKENMLWHPFTRISNAFPEKTRHMFGICSPKACVYTRHVHLCFWTNNVVFNLHLWRQCLIMFSWKWTSSPCNDS